MPPGIGTTTTPPSPARRKAQPEPPREPEFSPTSDQDPPPMIVPAWPSDQPDVRPPPLRTDDPESADQ